MPGAVPRSTRAAVLREHGAPLSIETLPLPERLAPGEAIVRVHAASLCGSDAELWRGDMGWPGMLPIVLGHEIVGSIVACGDGTRDALGRELVIGDRIGWSESVCGHCYACTVLHAEVACPERGYGMRQRADQPPYVIGGLSEFCFVAATADKLRIDDGLEDPLVAAAGCAMKTVVHAFELAGRIDPGETVVIQGAGALGMFAAAVARMRGASRVVVIGGPAGRLELTERFGADRTIGLDGSPEDRVAEVLELTGGRGAEVILDLAGAPGIADEAVRMAAQGGRYLVVGTTSDRPATIPLGMVMRKQLRIMGSVNGDFRHYVQGLTILRERHGEAPWLEIFDAPLPLSAAHEALVALSEQRSVKPLIDPRLPDPAVPSPEEPTA